jgi:putative MATE family efflux protein
MNKRINLGQGSILKNIISLSWPMMIGMFFQVMLNIIDAIFIGWYNTIALSALSLTLPVIFFIISIASGLSIGTASIVSRKLGEKKKLDAENAAENSILMAVVFGFFVTIIGIISSKYLFSMIGATEELLPLVLKFANISFCGSVFLLGMFVVSSILRGEGDSKTPMKFMIIATLINIILDPILIYGLFGLPELGISGAAISTLIAQAVAFFLGIRYLRSGKSYLNLNLKHFKFDISIIKETLRIGIPASLSQSVISFGMILMTKIVATFGVYTIASFGILGRLDSLAVLPVIGINTATLTIVGYNVGARNFERAEKTAWVACLIALAYGTIIGVLYFGFAPLFANMFSSDPDVVGTAIIALRIVEIFTGFSAIMIIISGSFQGAGHPVPSLIITILRLFILMLPFAFFFGIYYGYGINLVWWAFPFSGIISSIIAMLWFKKGTWKKNCHVEKEMMVCD